LLFEEEPEIRETVSVGAGCGIYKYANGTVGARAGTVGFPARNGSITGWVIAGHAVDGYTQFAYNGVHFGTLVSSAYYHNSTADAAFVRKDNGATVLSTIVGLGTIASYSTAAPPSGYVLTAYGQVSGRMTGTIDSTNHTSSILNGITFRNQWISSFVPVNGDSGGPVAYHTGSNRYKLYGIIRGAATSYGVVTPYGNIVNELNVSGITG